MSDQSGRTTSSNEEATMSRERHSYDLSFGDGCQFARNREPARVCKRSEKACPPCQRARDDDDDYEAETYGGGW